MALFLLFGMILGVAAVVVTLKITYLATRLAFLLAALLVSLVWAAIQSLSVLLPRRNTPLIHTAPAGQYVANDNGPWGRRIGR